MKRSELLCLFLVGALALVGGPRADATAINYTFQVDITSGTLKGETLDGTFAYDSSSITPGAMNFASGLLTELDFTLNGITYDESSANTGFLTFDSSGDLTDFLFGNDCPKGNYCTIELDENTWFVNGTTFTYDTYENDGLCNETCYPAGAGTVTFAAASVPEPGSLALLGTALLCLTGFTRRRALRDGERAGPQYLEGGTQRAQRT